MNVTCIGSERGHVVVGHTFYRETWAEINLKAIKHNIIEMKNLLPKNCQIMAVVKANGYGHGSVPVAQQALQSGAKSLAVALLEEALLLRRAGITAPILVLGRVAPEYASLAAQHQITLTFFQIEWLKEVNETNLSAPLNLHMKWDTGMGRTGIRSETELKEILAVLSEKNHIHLTGVYTHFASADEADLTYFNQQKVCFEKMLKRFKQAWPDPVQIHIGNSAAAIRFPKEMYNTVRFGIGMYGLYPSLIVKQEKIIDLQEAFSLHSQLIHVKQVAPGEAIGYGSEYIAKNNEWIGTIPIGYGDGWSRKLQGFDVLIGGKKAPIVGRVCMDQLMVRLDTIYQIGTEVVLIGKQKNDKIEFDDVAFYLDTINYEILCMLNDRIPRIYRNE